MRDLSADELRERMPALRRIEELYAKQREAAVKERAPGDSDAD